MANPLRLLKIYKSADTLVDVLDDGAAKPTLYHQSSYWTRVVSAAMALSQNIPLPKDMNMKNFWQKVAMVAGVVVTVGSQVQGLQLPLPPNVQGVLGLVLAVAGGIYHAVPGQPTLPTPVEAAKQG